MIRCPCGSLALQIDRNVEKNGETWVSQYRCFGCGADHFWNPAPEEQLCNGLEGIFGDAE